MSNSGAAGVSLPASLLVPNPAPFVTRSLASGYRFGLEFSVTLQTAPASFTSSYAVEDKPPAGWTVSSISDGGVMDLVQGAVKFGPFFDNNPRTLSYKVLPTTVSSNGIARFNGIGSKDGTDTVIVGTNQTSSMDAFHPADRNPADHRMEITEVTAYATAWRFGERWVDGPNPIPIDYVTRAGALWRGGEFYAFVPTVSNSVLRWVNTNSGSASATSASTS